MPILGGCEDTAPTSVAATEAPLPASVTAVPDGSALAAGMSPHNNAAILGQGEPGSFALFVDPRTVGGSEIFQIDGRIHIGGTSSPAGRLQVSDNFDGMGPTGQLMSIHNVSSAGDVTLEFQDSDVGVLANIGVVRARDGRPERVVISGEGRHKDPTLPLTLSEDGGLVGVGTFDPFASFHVRSDFEGGGPTVLIENANGAGDVAVDFRSDGELFGNLGIIRTDAPDRFFVLQSGNAGVLTLAENGANVGIGTSNPASTLDVNGNVHVSGDLVVDGTKSSVATLTDGRRVVLYAVESPQNWFEDFGAGQLQEGEAWVPLEPLFAETVNTDDEEYHVFLTPGGECNGLFVAEKRPNGFVVRELGSGTSSVAFDYRIVAPRAGFEGVRLEAVQ